jgi:hypothetical protein
MLAQHAARDDGRSREGIAGAGICSGAEIGRSAVGASAS